MINNAFAVSGLACIAGAAWLVGPAFGLFTVGAALLAVGLGGVLRPRPAKTEKR